MKCCESNHLSKLMKAAQKAARLVSVFKMTIESKKEKEPSIEY
jgi:hypothetical protein